MRILQYTLLYLQKIFKVQRNRNIEFRKGATWFSITDDLARYVVAHKEWIERTFKYSYCCDEVFLQTLVYNSTYKNKLFYSGFDNDYVSIQRLIDWDRGNPYVFRRVDFKEIENSDMMIARKFQSDVDLEIIEKVKKRFG